MTLDLDSFARVAWVQLWQVTVVAIVIGSVVKALLSPPAASGVRALDAGRHQVDRAARLEQPDWPLQLGSCRTAGSETGRRRGRHVLSWPRARERSAVCQ